MGCHEIDIADTIGVGTPSRVRAVMQAVTEVVDPRRISGHFHDTYGQSLANILTSMEVGVSIFHTSVSGLGGCPYAKGATGNVATEDVLFMLQGMEIETNIDFDAVVDIGQWISGQLLRVGGSRAGNAMAAKRVAS
jgi:hydroxymethylglutaryl-CoA lyase